MTLDSDALDAAAHEITDPKPHIEVTTEPEAIRDIVTAIQNGELPDLYVTDGRLVHLDRISGDTSTPLGISTDPAPLSLVSTVVDAPKLASILADHAYVYRIRWIKSTKAKKKSDDDSSNIVADDDEPGPQAESYEVMPPARVVGAILARSYWPGVRPLHGVIGSPVLRPDGSLLQVSGYDAPTGLYYAPKVLMPPIPAQPTQEAVTEARRFILESFLGDFPWVADADRANYIGLLITPILRPYLRTLTPFGLITATTAASGKTILSGGIGLLYGQNAVPWSDSAEELRKAITAYLKASAAVVIFDNVAEGAVIKHPVLAQLLTSAHWSDRELGTNSTAKLANDRLWLATGNNLRLGGDMVSRTVAVRLDPKAPQPELRTGFKIPNLDRWVTLPENQRVLLRHLLVLVMDWMDGGAPRADHVMRQYTDWAAAAGGFLAYHGISGFLGNAEALRGMDDEDRMWLVFFTAWREKFADNWQTSAKVRKSADDDPEHWAGRFPANKKTEQPVSTMSLGRLLRGQVGRFRGDLVLEADTDSHTKDNLWHVRKTSARAEAQ